MYIGEVYMYCINFFFIFFAVLFHVISCCSFENLFLNIFIGFNGELVFLDIKGKKTFMNI